MRTILGPENVQWTINDPGRVTPTPEDGKAPEPDPHRMVQVDFVEFAVVLANSQLSGLQPLQVADQNGSPAVTVAPMSQVAIVLPAEALERFAKQVLGLPVVETAQRIPI